MSSDVVIEPLKIGVLPAFVGIKKRQQFRETHPPWYVRELLLLLRGWRFVGGIALAFRDGLAQGDLSATVQDGIFRLNWLHCGLIFGARAVQDDSMQAAVAW